MAAHRNPSIEAAEQYLIWALEEIEKLGHANAVVHVRIALHELLTDSRSLAKTDKLATMYADKAKQFRSEPRNPGRRTKR